MGFKKAFLNKEVVLSRLKNGTEIEKIFDVDLFTADEWVNELFDASDEVRSEMLKKEGL